MAFHHNHHLSQAEMAAQFGGDHTTSSNHHHQPNWLTSALLNSSAVAGGAGNFLNLQSVEDSAGMSTIPSQPGELTHNEDSGKPEIGDGETSTGAGNSGGGSEQQQQQVNWQNAKFKAEILAHPLYEQLLSAHVACLRIATPVDQLPRIDAQLALSQNVVAKYSALGNGHALVGDDKELYQFMTHYVLLLCSFKEQLQQHVRVHAMEAVMACWEIEQSLQSLTGRPSGIMFVLVRSGSLVSHINLWLCYAVSLTVVLFSDKSTCPNVKRDKTINCGGKGSVYTYYSVSRDSIRDLEVL